MVKSREKPRATKLPPPGEIRPVISKRRLRLPQVSNMGRWRSSRGVISTPNVASSGYSRVNVLNHIYGFHRLVCRAFHGPAPEGKDQVNHIDLNRSNNAPENLEWVSAAQNMQHARETNADRKSSGPQLSKPVRGRRKLRARGQPPQDEDDNPWIPYDNSYAAAVALSLAPQSIIGCCRGKLCTTGGFQFEYDTEAATPTVLTGEEWRDVVLGSEPGEVSARDTTSTTSKRKYATPRVSSFGRFADSSGIVKVPALSTNGYMPVKVFGHQYGVHTLVCCAFHGAAPTSQHTCDHIDNDPGNNRADNLRWLTRSEQNLHSYATNAERGSSAGKTSKPIKGRVKATAPGEEERPWVAYHSAYDAARKLGLDRNAISQSRIKGCAAGVYEFVYDADAAEPGLLPGEVWCDVVMAEALL